MNGRTEDALGELLGALDVMRQSISVMEASIRRIAKEIGLPGKGSDPVICGNCTIGPKHKADCEDYKLRKRNLRQE